MGVGLTLGVAIDHSLVLLGQEASGVELAGQVDLTSANLVVFGLVHLERKQLQICDAIIQFRSDCPRDDVVNRELVASVRVSPGTGCSTHKERTAGSRGGDIEQSAFLTEALGGFVHRIHLINFSSQDYVIEFQTFDAMNGGQAQTGRGRVFRLARFDLVEGRTNALEIFLIFVQFPVGARDDANGFGFGLVAGHELFDVLRNGFSQGGFIGAGLENRRFTMHQ